MPCLRFAMAQSSPTAGTFRAVPRAAGLFYNDVADVLELRRKHRLQQVMPALNDPLADESRDGRHLLVLTDAKGEIRSGWAARRCCCGRTGWPSIAGAPGHGKRGGVGGGFPSSRLTGFLRRSSHLSGHSSHCHSRAHAARMGGIYPANSKSMVILGSTLAMIPE